MVCTSMQSFSFGSNELKSLENRNINDLKNKYAYVNTHYTAFMSNSYLMNACVSSKILMKIHHGNLPFFAMALMNK